MNEFIIPLRYYAITRLPYYHNIFYKSLYPTLNSPILINREMSNIINAFRSLSGLHKYAIISFVTGSLFTLDVLRRKGITQDTIIKYVTDGYISGAVWPVTIPLFMVAAATGKKVEVDIRLV